MLDGNLESGEIPVCKQSWTGVDDGGQKDEKNVDQHGGSVLNGRCRTGPSLAWLLNIEHTSRLVWLF